MDTESGLREQEADPAAGTDPQSGGKVLFRQTIDILQSLYTLRRHRNISIKQNEPRQTSQLNTNPHLFARARVLAAAVGCLG